MKITKKIKGAAGRLKSIFAGEKPQEVDPSRDIFTMEGIKAIALACAEQDEEIKEELEALSVIAREKDKKLTTADVTEKAYDILAKILATRVAMEQEQIDSIDIPSLAQNLKDYNALMLTLDKEIAARNGLQNRESILETDQTILQDAYAILSKIKYDNSTSVHNLEKGKWYIPDVEKFNYKIPAFNQDLQTALQIPEDTINQVIMDASALLQGNTLNRFDFDKHLASIQSPQHILDALVNLKDQNNNFKYRGLGYNGIGHKWHGDVDLTKLKEFIKKDGFPKEIFDFYDDPTFKYLLLTQDQVSYLQEVYRKLSKEDAKDIFPPRVLEAKNKDVKFEDLNDGDLADLFTDLLEISASGKPVENELFTSISAKYPHFKADFYYTSFIIKQVVNGNMKKVQRNLALDKVFEKIASTSKSIKKDIKANDKNLDSILAEIRDTLQECAGLCAEIEDKNKNYAANNGLIATDVNTKLEKMFKKVAEKLADVKDITDIDEENVSFSTFAKTTFAKDFIEEIAKFAAERKTEDLESPVLDAKTKNIQELFEIFAVESVAGSTDLTWEDVIVNGILDAAEDAEIAALLAPIEDGEDIDEDITDEDMADEEETTEEEPVEETPVEDEPTEEEPAEDEPTEEETAEDEPAEKAEEESAPVEDEIVYEEAEDDEEISPALVEDEEEMADEEGEEPVEELKDDETPYSLRSPSDLDDASNDLHKLVNVLFPDGDPVTKAESEEESAKDDAPDKE